MTRFTFEFLLPLLLLLSNCTQKAPRGCQKLWCSRRERDLARSDARFPPTRLWNVLFYVRILAMALGASFTLVVARCLCEVTNVRMQNRISETVKIYSTEIASLRWFFYVFCSSRTHFLFSWTHDFYANDICTQTVEGGVGFFRTLAFIQRQCICEWGLELSSEAVVNIPFEKQEKCRDPPLTLCSLHCDSEIKKIKERRK